MSQLTIQDLDETLWRRLRERAEAHGQTPEVEAKTILAQTLGSASDDVWARVDLIHGRLAASGRAFSDSAEALCEDRQR